MRTEKQGAVFEESAMARVVAAERAWRDQLASARRDGESLVAAAQADACEQAALLDRTLPGIVADRRSRFEAETERQVVQITEESAGVAAQLEALTEDAVRRLAERILCEAPWLHAAGEVER